VASKDSDSDEIAAYTGGGQHIKIERPPVRIEKTDSGGCKGRNLR
jgi:hypothetical protein